MKVKSYFCFQYKSNQSNFKTTSNQMNDANLVAKTAYVTVNMKVSSLEDLNQRYAAFVFPILHKHEGEMIAGTPTPLVKEGEWDGNWAAILRFPSMEKALAWYNDEDYQPYKNLRINEMQLEAGRVIMLESLV